MSSTDHGRFCWHDLKTTDPAGSRAFYAEMFGWRTRAVDAGDPPYEMIFAGERAIGGVVTLGDGPGGATSWVPYIAVEDGAAFCARATALGGEVVVPPTDIGPGIYAVVMDPQGGVFSPWQTKEPGPAEPEKGTLHVFSWDECLSTDADAGAAFYAELCGWRPEAQEMEVGGQKATYHVFWRGDDHQSGILDLPPDAVAQGARTHWLPYVTVADVDAAAVKAADLGAELLCPCTDIPGVGRFCVIRDPQGAELAMYTSA